MKHKEFLKKLEERNEHFKNGEFEVVGEYVGILSPITIKDNYGNLSIIANSLLKGNKPSIRSAIDKTQYLINKLNEKHENKYEYPNYKFTTVNIEIDITCPIHGDFKQRLNKHLYGHSCPQCYKPSFKKEDWYNMCKGNPGIFYILRCWNEDEEFYKVGITCSEVKYRYSGKMPYNYEILIEETSEDRKYIWNLEKKYKQLLKEYHYEPKIKFGGSKFECFKIINNKN